MKVQVHFKVIDPDFNKAYADEYHNGEESESNHKYLWASSYELRNVKSVSTLEGEDFILKGKFEGEVPFAFNIPNVQIFRCHFEDGAYEDFAVSKSVLNKIHQAKREGYAVTRFYFYINSTPPSHALSSNLVIDEKDIPTEFIRK